MLFSDRIRSLREAKKITQRTMTQALGIGVPMYSRIERGERAVRKEQIQVLAKVLDTDFNELLKLWLADQVSTVMDGEEDKFNEVTTIAKSDIRKMSNSVFKLGELFCGPGGLACGAISAHSNDNTYGIEHLWASDFDKDSCITYADNICNGDRKSVICEDVRTLDINSLPDIDAFAYGFPCNSFSNVGEHSGLSNEKYGQLYWYGVEVLRKFKPKWFIAENVSGIRSAGKDDFKIILKDLKDSGYNLTTHLYKAEDYGIPQTRHRVIIVGIRSDLDVVFHVPDPAMYSDIDISAKKALSNIPHDAPNNERRRLSQKIIDRLSYIEPGQNIWQAEEQIPTRLRIKTKTKISQIYRKLDPDKPSYTITASGGGGTFGYHWDNRELTNRERARIQTFPDNYVFYGNYSSVRKQIGMAVPCKLSNIVVTAILNSFAHINYPYINPNISFNE